MKSLFTKALPAALLITLIPLAGLAEGWEYRVAPYVFLPSLDLDSTVAGQTVPVDLDFGDVIDSFDVLGFSARGEAWNGPYGLIADFYWVDLDGGFGPGESINVAIEEMYMDLLGGYRWIKTGAYSRASSLEVAFGIRIHSLEQTINTPETPTLGGDDDWVDLLLGGRAIHPVSDSWLLSLRGDIGGFDLTDGTELNWSVNGMVNWEFTRSWLLNAGYRVYGIDYESRNQGISNFGMDGIEHGPIIGVTWAPRD